MTSLAIGLASGLGNSIFMLPAIKALKLLGHRIALYVQTDFPTADLWRRCAYADEVLEPSAGLNSHSPICGQWRPAAWSKITDLMRFQVLHPYRVSEWQSNMRLASSLGWSGEAPDVSDWCRDLDRSYRWDVGIVPGSKEGVWLRKRWPGMPIVAGHFVGRGRRVAVFGLKSDGVLDIPGEFIPVSDIGRLPDVLAGCRVIIGTDSGVTHLASSLGVPVAIVFTATSERKGDPVGRQSRKILLSLPCRPCQSSARWYACQDWRCRKIDPDVVIRAAEELCATS